MDHHKETYVHEANELLADLETALLELEETPDNRELIDLVFRKMHTIKGSGAMFGFDDIADFTHEVETVFDLVRERKISVTSRLVSLTLSACDQIKMMVEGRETDASETGEIVESFREMLPESGSSSEGHAISNDELSRNESGSKTFRIRFKLSPGIFASGTNPIYLLEDMRQLGQCVIVAHTRDIPLLSEIDPESCYLFWDVILTTKEGVDAIKDVFIFVEDDCELVMDVIDEEGLVESEANYKKLGEILLERGDVSLEDLKNALGKQKRVGELLVEEKAVDRVAIESALAEQQHVKQTRKIRQEAVASSTIRVPAERLDALVDLVGELVTVQARLTQVSASFGTAELTSISEEVERLTSELRDNTMGIRMLPIGTTFARFKRLVRDLSKELEKDVVLKTEGGETELDKTVIERLNDPLVHLIRNSIDHGIESPEERIHAGKPAEGTVRLSAKHRGAEVVINVEDDGAGLDVEAIRAKAVEKGLMAPDAAFSEDEILMQILAPGFSTAKEVSDVSGRGVGMDVVKKSMDALQGSVGVSSEKGRGTIITLKVPLTLAIIDGLMVRVGDGDYIFPLSSVEECVELSRDEADRARKRKMMELRGQMISYLSLCEYLKVNGKRPPFEKIVIVDLNGKKLGLGVDYVIGKHQTVIKALGDIYKDIEGLSGATIKGDGTVALILDVNMLVESMEQVRYVNQFLSI